MEWQNIMSQRNNNNNEEFLSILDLVNKAASINGYLLLLYYYKGYNLRHGNVPVICY